VAAGLILCHNPDRHRNLNPFQNAITIKSKIKIESVLAAGLKNRWKEIMFGRKVKL
jgi:hypothetical protein